MVKLFASAASGIGCLCKLDGALPHPVKPPARLLVNWDRDRSGTVATAPELPRKPLVRKSDHTYASQPHDPLFFCFINRFGRFLRLVYSIAQIGPTMSDEQVRPCPDGRCQRPNVFVGLVPEQCPTHHGSSAHPYVPETSIAISSTAPKPV